MSFHTPRLSGRTNHLYSPSSLRGGERKQIKVNAPHESKSQYVSFVRIQFRIIYNYYNSLESSILYPHRPIGRRLASWGK